MARPNRRLISALKRVAARLSEGERFEWGHMGRCNCGYLAQELTSLSPADIHREALERARYVGVCDWTEHVIEHCPRTGFTFEHIVDEMLSAGMSRKDIAQLESLSDPEVLAALPDGQRYLERNRREDAILYLATWADLLDRQLSTPHSSASPAAASTLS